MLPIQELFQITGMYIAVAAQTDVSRATTTHAPQARHGTEQDIISGWKAPRLLNCETDVWGSMRGRL